ncbi:MAG: transporter, substrate-binding protein, aliphatic sulfonates family [Burkholderiaceae bacterium]|nr:transporter, substrate-binding protein, aliphatic sulfonates family [Burkholderiaceae bacterium]
MNRRNFLKLSGATLAASALAGVSVLGCKSSSKPVLKIGHLPLTDHLTIIAHSQFEYQHLTLEPVKFSSWPELLEALRSGAIQGGFALTPFGLALRQKGAPIKLVQAGHRNGSSLTIKNDPAITKLEDLRGKTIAIPSRFSTHNILLSKLLHEHGLSADKDVKVLEMGPPEMVNALSTGRIDAFIVAEPFGAQAEILKVGKALVYSKDVWKDHICCGLNLHETVINQHPEAVEELVGNFVKTANFIEANPKEAAQLSTRYLGQKPEVIQYVLETPKDRVSFRDLVPTASEIQTTQDYLVQFGISKERVDVASYLDDRFARKAYQA